MRVLTAIYLLIAAMSTFIFTPGQALAGKKVALVIGNSDYSHVQPLRNPANDARAISDLFTKMGYDVHLVLNASRDELASAVGDFSQISSGADAAIFYYAGHGVSLDGHNFLIPVNAEIERASDVKLGGGFDAETAIDEALSNAKVKLVFLDACRDNPFVEKIKRSLGTTRSAGISSGLSEMKSGEGTLIAFSTAPGQTALDGDGNLSPFAAALLKNLAEPGLEVRLAMTKVRADVETATSGQQTPWESTNLTGFFYFGLSPTKLPEDSAAGIPDPDTVAALDIEYWQSVKDTGDPMMIQSYLDRFPDGVYRALAHRKIQKLKEITAAKSTTTTEVFAESDIQKSQSVSHDSSTESNAKSPTSGKTRTKPPSNLEQRTQPTEKIGKRATEANVPVNGNSLGGKNEARFLSKMIRMNGAVWTMPAGAVNTSPRMSRNFTVIYKGRRYACHPLGATTGMTRVSCSLL